MVSSSSSFERNTTFSCSLFIVLDSRQSVLPVPVPVFILDNYKLLSFQLCVSMSTFVGGIYKKSSRSKLN